MTLRAAIDAYVAWRRAHDAKFVSSTWTLRQFCRHAGDGIECGNVGKADVLEFVAGKDPLTRNRANTARRAGRILPLCGQPGPCRLPSRSGSSAQLPALTSKRSAPPTTSNRASAISPSARRRTVAARSYASTENSSDSRTICARIRSAPPRTSNLRSMVASETSRRPSPPAWSENSVRLFERIPTGVHPTLLTAVNVEHARRILRNTEDDERSVAAALAGRYGRVTAAPLWMQAVVAPSRPPAPPSPRSTSLSATPHGATAHGLSLLSGASPIAAASTPARPCRRTSGASDLSTCPPRNHLRTRTARASPGLPLDLLDLLPGTLLRAPPLAFGLHRFRTGLVARRPAGDLTPFRMLEADVRDAALQPGPELTGLIPACNIRRIAPRQRTRTGPLRFAD